MTTAVHALGNKGGSLKPGDEDIPFKSGSKTYFVTLILTLVVAVAVMVSLFYF